MKIIRTNAGRTRKFVLSPGSFSNLRKGSEIFGTLSSMVEKLKVKVVRVESSFIFEEEV